MEETVEARARRLGLAPQESVEERALRLGLIHAPPTGHAGKPFVDAPEMRQQHNGKPFVDAMPEPSYLEGVAARGASLGRYMGDDVQSGVRAVTRDRGVLDVVKELGNMKGSDVLNAMKFGGIGAGSLVIDALKRTPSYARAHTDIRAAEDRVDPTVRNALALAGAGVQLAPLAEAAASGAVRAFRSLPAGRLGEVARIVAPKTTGKVSALADLFRSEPAVASPGSTLRIPKGPTLEGYTGNIPPAAPDSPAADRVLSLVRNTPTASPAVAPASQEPSALDRQLNDLLTKARASQPHEIGATYGDAEEAMGLSPHQQPDLEALLRESLRAKGAVPRIHP